MTDVNDLGSLPVDLTPNNVPAHLQDLKDRINAGSLARRLTQAQIDSLPAGQKVIGVLVYNSTAQRFQAWDGATFRNVSGITINDDGSISVKSVIVKDGTAEALRLWLNGGTAMVDSGVAGRPLRLTSGPTTLALTYGGGATLSPQTAPGDGPSNLVTKGYVDGLIPAFTSWTPAFTQGSAVAATVAGRVLRSGKLRVVTATATFTGAGTSGQPITMSLPDAAAAGLPGGGSFWHYDFGNTNYAGYALIKTPATARFIVPGWGNEHGEQPSISINSGDTFSVTLTYEAA